MKKLKIRLILFAVIVLGCGWLGKVVDTILPGQPKGQSLGLLLWLVAPMMVSVLLGMLSHSEYKTLGLKPRLKGNGRWYLISFIIFPGIMIFSIGMGIITRSIDLKHFAIQGFISSLFTWFIINFFRTILEETAWRGFLQERLIILKVNDWGIYFITALIWALWHIPYYLFYIEGNSAQMIVSCFAILFSWSILYAELYRITRTIWPCVLLHAASNAIQYTMADNYLATSGNWELIFSPTESIMACSIILTLGLLLRRYRIKKYTVQSQSQN